jgi:hypothetical protein
VDIWEPHKNTISIVVFTVPLERNGSYPIVACIFVAAGMYLRSRCLGMVYMSQYEGYVLIIFAIQMFLLWGK